MSCDTNGRLSFKIENKSDEPVNIISLSDSNNTGEYEFIRVISIGKSNGGRPYLYKYQPNYNGSRILSKRIIPAHGEFIYNINLFSMDWTPGMRSNPLVLPEIKFNEINSLYDNDELVIIYSPPPVDEKLNIWSGVLVCHGIVGTAKGVNSSNATKTESKGSKEGQSEVPK